MPLPRPVLVLWAATGLLVAVHLLQPAGRAADATYLAAVLAAPVVGWFGARTAPRQARLVPVLLAAGVTAAALGDLLWDIYSWLGAEPDVSWADVPYYASYLGVGAAVLVITVRHRTDRGRVDVDAVVDALTVVVVSVLVFWTTSIHELAEDRSVSPLTRLVVAGYPVLDAVLLALVIRALSVRHRREQLGIATAIGVGCWLASDLGYLLFPIGDSLTPLMDAGWMVGAALVAAATWRPVIPVEAEHEAQQARTPLGQLGIAIVPLAVPPLLLLGNDVAGREPPLRMSVAAMLTLLAVAFVRTYRLLRSERRAHEELAKARDEALAASRAKSSFLATMSHEIRTPLNGVIGLNELLLTTTLDDRQRQYVEGVRSSGRALLDVINEVLDFSRIESGHLELEEADFDLVQLVEDVAEMVSEPAMSKRLELLAYCSPEVPAALRGDPARLRQVLLNLAGNAVKFTPAGEVVIRAQLESRSDESVTVRFEVADTGIGIADGNRARLFEPFMQADSSTTRRYGGTGLGLAICRQLVAAMGGSLGVLSEPGTGSTFWFTVPLGVAAHDSLAAPPRPTTGLAGVRVLVVDDNTTNLAILNDQLRHWGMSVDVADGADRALLRLRQAAREARPYDLALVDLCMPDVDGLELARRVARQPAISGTTVVLMTSAPDVSAAEAAEASVAVVLTKPVLLSRLRETLAQLVAARPAGRASAARAASPAPSRGRVLVVDDGEVNRLVAVGILNHLGYTPVAVDDGRQALGALADGAFDAVLMDVQMPGLDGYQTTAELRRLEAGRHTPVIAMTATVTEGERERCLAAGMDDYLGKPITPATVSAVLERWMALREAQPS